MNIKELQTRIVTVFQLHDIQDTIQRADITGRIMKILSGRIADTLIGKLPDQQIGQLEELINNGLTHEDLLKYFQTMDAFDDIIRSEIEKLKGEIMV